MPKAKSPPLPICVVILASYLNFVLFFILQTDIQISYHKLKSLYLDNKQNGGDGDRLRNLEINTNNGDFKKKKYRGPVAAIIVIVIILIINNGIDVDALKNKWFRFKLRQEEVNRRQHQCDAMQSSVRQPVIHSPPIDYLLIYLSMDVIGKMNDTRCK